MEQNTILTFAQQLSNPQQYLDNGLRIFLQLLLFMKMAANYLCMFLGSSKIISFYQRASAFEDRIGIPWCGCCSPRGFFWSDLQRAFVCVLYCITAMFTNSLDSYERDSAFIRPLACTKLFLHMVFYFVYDNIYVVALRSSSQVLCTYLDDQFNMLRCCIENQAFRIGGHAGDAQRVQAVRLNLATVHQLKEAVNDIWRWPLVISSLCVLLEPCICVHEASRPGFITEQRYVSAISAAYLMYEYITLVYVSQSLINKVQELYGSIDPDDMALKGADFFHLRMSLLISVSIGERLFVPVRGS
ncbi:hypothetical protein MTO96_012406 [Rhipicephalus appendiculatus]